MRLRRVRVANFRSIRHAEVELGPHTAILGGNGAGKSTLLRAIERFYAPSTAIELDDFFGRSTDHPIEIELTFSDLDTTELEQFGSHVHNGEMSVVRVFDANAGRNNGRYYGLSLQHLAFSGIRAVPSAAEKRAAYNALRSNAPYNTLPAVSRADAIEGHLVSWESEHPDRCELGRDGGQFFGFSNVGRGSLQRFTTFVFIPAVREAGSDAIDARGSVIARLMELVVRNAIQQRRDIRQFQTEMSDRYRALTDPSNLTELGDLSSILTETLRRLYLEAAVHLRWREADDFIVPLPTADVLLDDDGFEGPVDRKGHGLQRAFILTLLQHLAHASAQASSASPEATPPQPAHESGGDDSGESDEFVLPGLVLAIEEPELYQHPTKQRHFANVLRRLSEGSLPGVAARTQVIFASHSSLFVATDRFDEIRLARRRTAPGLTHKECVLANSTLGAVCRRLEAAFGEPEGTRTVEGLQSRLHVLGPELSEGFFADLVVLVEGPSDRAAIIAAAALTDVDLSASGVAVLPVTGKTGLMNPACIFRELHIPTFVIWDCDRGEDNANVPYNLALQRISGVAEIDLRDFISFVGYQWASFEVDLETTLRAEIGSDHFDQYLEEARNRFGLQHRSDVSKSPSAMIDVLRTADANGQRSSTMHRIVQSVAALSSLDNVASDGTGGNPSGG